MNGNLEMIENYLDWKKMSSIADSTIKVSRKTLDKFSRDFKKEIHEFDRKIKLILTNRRRLDDENNE